MKLTFQNFLTVFLLLFVSAGIYGQEGSGNWKLGDTGRQTSLWVPSYTTGNTGYDMRGFMMLPSTRSGQTAYNNAYKPGHRFYVFLKAGETVYYSFRHASGNARPFSWYYDNTANGENNRFPEGITGAQRTLVTGTTGNSSTNANLTRLQTTQGQSPLAGGTNGYQINSSNGGSFTNATGAGRAYWLEFTSANAFEITDWDVTVADGNNVQQTRRVYSKYWSMQNGLPSAGENTNPNASSFHNNFGFYVPVDNEGTPQDDYLVKSINFGGSNAGYVVFFANSTGPRNNLSLEENRKSITGTSNLYQYPLFVADPDESLWPSSSIADPLIDLVFKRKELPETGAEGHLTVYIEYPANVEILVDLDMNGVFSGTDVIISNYFETSGYHTIIWNGEDSNGDGIAYGQEIQFISSVGFFPVHFPVFDMEQSNGMVFENVRPGTPGPETIFWDHSNLSTGTTPANSWSLFTGQPLINTVGMTSPDTNNNLWNRWYGTGDNGFGNSRTINTWTGASTYYSITAVNFIYDEADLEVTKTVDQDEVNVGENVTFTITHRNLGISWAKEVEADDELQSGLQYVSHTIIDNNTDPYNSTYDPVTGVWSIVSGTDRFMPGDELTLEIVAKVLGNGPVTNTVNVPRPDPDPSNPPTIEPDPDQSNNTATATVTGINSGSILAIPDINQTPAGESVSGNILTNDSGNGTLTVTGATYLDENGDEQPLTLGTATEIYDENGNKAGSLTLNSDGSYTFVPEPGYSGNVPISYTAVDSDGATGSSTLIIKVVEDLKPNGNNPSIANDDTAYTLEGTPLHGTVLNNDSDPDGDNSNLRVTEVVLLDNSGNPYSVPVPAGSDTGTLNVYDEDPLNPGTYIIVGTFAMDDLGGFLFTPATGFTGALPPISYTVTDGNNQYATADLYITVLEDDGTNHTFANDDANSAAQGETMNGNVLNNDTDPEGDSQSVTAIVINGISYPVDQGGADTTVTTAEGTFTIDKDGNYTFVPDPDFTGTLVVEMTVCDSRAAPDTACDNSSLYLTSLPFDSLSMHAVLDINQTQMDIPVNGNVLTNDYGVGLTVIGATYLDTSGNEQPLTLGTATEVYDQNGHKAGTLTLNADGSYTFVPEEGYIGDVPVSYTVENEDGITAEAPLTIQVIQPLNPEENDPPIAHDDTAYTLEGVPVGGTVTNNDSDPDGDNSNLRVTEIVLLDSNGTPYPIPVPAGSDTGYLDVYGEDPLNPGTFIVIGTFSIADNGGFLFSPAPGFTGEVPPISYTITDGEYEYATAELYITVLENDGNNYTFANDDANSGIQGETMDGNVLTNDSDPEGNTQTVSSIVINGTAYPVNPDGSQTTVTTTEGTFTIDKDGNYTFEPDTDFTGTLVVEINVCDDADPQACNTSTLYLTSFSNETTCYENVNGEDFSWSYPSGTPSPVVETFTQPGTNGGFVLDLFALDNSFNMNINGIQLATQEIEFQQAGTLGQNIRFVDGTIWEQGGIPAIWQLIGTPEKPIVRVIIDKNGNVTMYGSKTSGGDLMKLELFDGNTFNTVNWNQATNNTIEVTQTVVGLTLMAGTGYGRNIIDCACYKPGVFAAGAGLPTNVGISSLRIDNSDGWPQVREGGWIALEAKTKGFVPNRLTAAQIALIPSGDLVSGMMVYNITEDCLQINVDGTAAGWKCFSEQSCLD